MWDTFKSHRIPAENLSASKLRRQTEQKEQPWANDSFFLALDGETDYEYKENRINSPQGSRRVDQNSPGLMIRFSMYFYSIPT